MIVIRDHVGREFVYAVKVLAMDKENQWQYHAPTCAICDMSIDYETYLTPFLDGYRDELRADMIKKVEEIDSLLNEYWAKQLPCDPSSLDDEIWQRIRLVSKQVIEECGWEKLLLPRFVSNEDGIWKREK